MHSKDGVRIAHARPASFQIQNGGCVTMVFSNSQPVVVIIN